MNLAGFIAKRYLFAKKSHNVINIISAISAIGMAIGTAALIIILSVYNGFDSLIKTMMSNVEPDLLITPSAGKTFVPDAPGEETNHFILVQIHTALVVLIVFVVVIEYAGFARSRLLLVSCHHVPP